MTEIVRMKFGSHLYGTATENSDTDIKAIHIPSAEQILLGRTPRAINQVTKINEREKNSPEDTDFESLSLHHFMKLFMEGQTVCFDMVFANPEAIISKTWHWDWIVANRKEFISSQCQSYLGYCKQQANKYGIKGSRVAAVREVLRIIDLEIAVMGHLAKVGEINWESYQLPEHTEVLGITIANGQTIKHISCCNRKVPFGTTLKEAKSVYQRLFDEYGKRALMAESNEGVDWKALSHAVRIGKQAITVLNGGEVEFPLSYAPHLLEIKRGQHDFSVISLEIDELLKHVEDAAANSPLPAEPNRSLAEQFILFVYGLQVEHAHFQAPPNWITSDAVA